MRVPVQPFNDFAMSAAYLDVLENMREHNIFTPVVGYHFTEQMLGIIETEDSAHFLADMAEKGVLTYRVHEPTQSSLQHTISNYLVIETVDMATFPNAAQVYIDECSAPMAGPVAEQRAEQERRHPGSKIN